VTLTEPQTKSKQRLRPLGSSPLAIVQKDDGRQAGELRQDNDLPAVCRANAHPGSEARLWKSKALDLLRPIFLAIRNVSAPLLGDSPALGPESESPTPKAKKTTARHAEERPSGQQ